MKIKILLLIVFLTHAVSWTKVFANSSDETDPLIAQASLQMKNWRPGQGGNLNIEMTLPSGFHAYEEQFKLKINSPFFKFNKPTIKPMHDFFDKNSQKNRRGMKDKATLTSFIEATENIDPNLTELSIELTYQACGESFCLFPKTKKLTVPIEVHLDEITTTIENPTKSNLNKSVSATLKEKLESNLIRGSFWAFFIVFIAGILTSFTPCIFPMIPITLSILGHGAEKRTRWQNFLLSLFYVHGIAFTYSLLGVAAAKGGSVFGSSLGNQYVLSFVCIIMLLMALSMYGLFEIQVPAIIRNHFGNKKTETSYFGAFISGLFAGIVASPCVGPILVTILTFVSTTQNVFLGFFLLFTYAIGLGLIFLLLGVFSQLLKFLPRSGAWMNGVKILFGTLMMMAFYYYLNLLIPERYFDFLVGIGLIIFSSVYGAFNKHPHTPGKQIKKGLLLAVFYIGLTYLVIGFFNLRPALESHFSTQNTSAANQNSLSWKPLNSENLTVALQSGQPVILDFWAEWCAACHELEEKTFSDALVIEKLKQFQLLKFDATNESEILKEYKNKFSIQGLPTLIFYNAKGQKISTLTLTEFESPQAFQARLDKILESKR